MAEPPRVVNRQTAPRHVWQEVCEAWTLADGPDLSVKLERMPPETAETRHRHEHARQVFFVLSGRLAIEVGGEVHQLAPRDGLEVRPGLPHKVENRASAPVDFLVISAPSADGDRHSP